MTSTDMQKAQYLIEAAQNLKAEELTAIQIGELSSFADVFLIATGNSDRHVRAIADAVAEASDRQGQPPLGIEGYEEGQWVLIDLDDVVVHVFLEDVRKRYDLERLWSEAPRIEITATGDTA